MVLPGKNTHTAHWRIVFPFTPVTYFLFDCFFPGLFVFSHMKLDRETFDHTMCEVNTKKKGFNAAAKRARVDECCQQRS